MYSHNYMVDKADSQPVSGDRQAGADEVKRLKLDLMDQWITNHAEHCGRIPHWPHDGRCHWPMPKALADLPHGETYLLLLEASGESVGLRLQSAEG